MQSSLAFFSRSACRGMSCVDWQGPPIESLQPASLRLVASRSPPRQKLGHHEQFVPSDEPRHLVCWPTETNGVSLELVTASARPRLPASMRPRSWHNHHGTLQRPPREYVWLGLIPKPRLRDGRTIQSRWRRGSRQSWRSRQSGTSGCDRGAVFGCPIQRT